MWLQSQEKDKQPISTTPCALVAEHINTDFLSGLLTTLASVLTLSSRQGNTRVFALKLRELRSLTVHSYTDKTKIQLGPFCNEEKLLRSHFQFGRAHCFPQFVSGLAYIHPRVRKLQISQNQRTEPFSMMLYGRSARFRHRLLIVKPFHLWLRIP